MGLAWVGVLHNDTYITQKALPAYSHVRNNKQRQYEMHCKTCTEKRQRSRAMPIQRARQTVTLEDFIQPNSVCIFRAKVKRSRDRQFFLSPTSKELPLGDLSPGRGRSRQLLSRIPQHGRKERPMKKSPLPRDLSVHLYLSESEGVLTESYLSACTSCGT